MLQIRKADSEEPAIRMRVRLCVGGMPEYRAGYGKTCRAARNGCAHGQAEQSNRTVSADLAQGQCCKYNRHK